MKTTLEDKYLLFQLNVEVWLCRYLGSLYIKVPQNDSVGAKNSFPNWTVGITTFIDGNKVHQGVIITWVRYNSRFFVQFGHETTNAYSGNKHCFTMLCLEDLPKLSTKLKKLGTFIWCVSHHLACYYCFPEHLQNLIQIYKNLQQMSAKLFLLLFQNNFRFTARKNR